jgi:hypothetical protein
MHTRRLEFEGFRRADGLWDIEGTLSDVKTIDCHLESGVRPAGQFIHRMHVRLTIDEQFDIVSAEAVSDDVPYAGACDTIGPAYSRLAGLNLLKGFRKQVIEIFGGMKGCTHITELLGSFPTAAVQSIFQRSSHDVKPFQLDRCQALDTSGENVRRFYPRWYRGPHPQ